MMICMNLKMGAYSLSETASLSFRCSSLPSANLRLLSVASTHLHTINRIEIALNWNCWQLHLFPSWTPSPSLSTRSNFSFRFWWLSNIRADKAQALYSQRSGCLPRQMIFGQTWSLRGRSTAIRWTFWRVERNSGDEIPTLIIIITLSKSNIPQEEVGLHLQRRGYAPAHHVSCVELHLVGWIVWLLWRQRRWWWRPVLRVLPVRLVSDRATPVRGKFKSWQECLTSVLLSQ